VAGVSPSASTGEQGEVVPRVAGDDAGVQAALVGQRDEGVAGAGDVGVRDDQTIGAPDDARAVARGGEPAAGGRAHVYRDRAGAQVFRERGEVAGEGR
jgi:hypothetical protein